MIIDETAWGKFFKNFDVYDCTYGFEHDRVGLLLIEILNEDHEEYDNPWYTPKEGANKRGNSSRLTQPFHFFMFEPIFSPVNALNQPI
ncbi:hypothetical protein [Citrobacter freundii]|uniref:hypothetical protein n=1 Tax=Citrobacter freundii TaxID=546 RepID=UPI00388F1091